MDGYIDILIRVLLELLPMISGIPIPSEMLVSAIFFVLGVLANGFLAEPGADFYHWLKRRIVLLVRGKRTFPNMSVPEEKDLPPMPCVLYAVDVQTNDDQSPINHRFTVPEAAAVLGISPEAVRARIHRGTLHKEKAPGGTVYVRLDDDQSKSNGSSPDDKTPDQSTMEEVLREQVAYLREQLDREREARTEERRRQDTIIAQLTQANAALARRVPELPPSSVVRNGHEVARQYSEGVEPQSDTLSPQTGVREPEGGEGTARRPWWLRILRGGEKMHRSFTSRKEA